MSMRLLSGSFAAAVFCCAVSAGAQTAAQQPSDQKATPTSPAITVSGCVQKETLVLKRNPATGNLGMNDEFVITQAVLNREGATAEKSPTEVGPPPAELTGTSGKQSNFGKVYRVTGVKESELENYVGQRVEIVGTFKLGEDAKAAPGAVGTSGGAPATGLTPANTPEITIDVIRPVPGACSVAVK
jgi:hypothetical protein